MTMTKDSVERWLNHQTESEYIRLWNQYCDNVSCSEDCIYEFTDDFIDEILSGRAPSEIFRMGYYSRIDDWTAPYARFRLDALETVDNPRLIVDEDELIEAIMEDPKEYGYEPEFE